jgi:Dolichyl-phosphate-mannose-protein mannosyltransferase
MINAKEPATPETETHDLTSVDSVETGPEGPESSTLSVRRSVLFLCGAAVVVVGLWIMRSVDLVGFSFPGFFDRAARRYVHAYREVLVGGGVVMVGAIAAAFAVRESIPDRLRGTSLAFVRGWNLRRCGPVLVAGVVCYAIVLGLVAHDKGSPWVFLLFLAALALFGFAVHRADMAPPGPRLGFGRVDAVILPALVALVGSVNLVELNHWRFSFIGDEGAFFSTARNIANGVRVNLFDLSGVYNTHPILDSVYLAQILKVFGADITGWRLAEVVVLTASAVLIYALVLILFGRLPAVVAAVILGSNHLLMAFARIGYNNLHAVFYTLLVVLFLVLAWRSERALFTFLTGAATGLCLYTFPAALLIWPVAALLVGVKCLRRPTVREFAALGLMLAGFVLVVTPGLITSPPDHFVEMVANHGHRELAVQDPIRVTRFSLVQSFLVFWTNPQWYHHYVGGPLLDPIACVLFSIGLALGILLIRKGAPRIGVVWFGTGLFLIAVTNYVTQPLFTRLLVLIPACAVLAAMGVAGLETSLKGLRFPTRLGTGLILVLTAAIPILNLQQLLVKSPQVIEMGYEVIIVKALQENPGRTVIEIGRERDQNLAITIDRYPRLREFYRFSTLDELELPPKPAGPDDRLPIFLMRDYSSARELNGKLSLDYLRTSDIGTKGYPQIWLFMPPK